MNKAELVDAIGRATDVSKRNIEQVLDAFRTTIVNEVKKNNRVSLIGFGSFNPTKRGARSGRNPQTGAAMRIPASKGLRFAVSSTVKDVLNGKAAAPAVKKVAPPKKAAPAGKPAAAKKAAATKKAAPRVSAKAAPAKKAVPAGKPAAAKKAAPARKPAPAKKAAPARRPAPSAGSRSR